MNELDLARAIAAGRAPSPSRFGNVTLWALRVTGTGRAERGALGEICWRDPGTWLSAETIERCAGLPVIWDHPAGGLLNSNSFAERVVGNLMLAYPATRAGIADERGPDLWAVAVIRDDAANEVLRADPLSTSPAVAFKRNDGSFTFQTADGTMILLEGVPALIDHLAICQRGVWDKSGEPSGVRDDLAEAEKESTVTEPVPPEARKDGDPAEAPAAAPPKPAPKTDADPAEAPAAAHEGNALQKLLASFETLTDAVAKIGSRMDALEDERSGVEREAGEPRRPAADSYMKRQDQKASEMTAMRQAQARADAVFMALGERAPAPLSGERPLDFRRRLARGLQRHSEGFKKVNLEELPAGEGFDAIESRIYTDALEASRNPVGVPGMLREIRKRDHTGREIIEFVGPDTFIGLMRPNAKRVIGFNLKPNGN